jgi:predicted MFS family arabinose efflux permease
MMMRAAPSGREGWASASLNLADVLGIALGVGVGGAAVAAVSRGSQPIAGGVVIAFAAAALAAVLALVVARRLPGSLERNPAQPVTR